MLRMSRWSFLVMLCTWTSLSSGAMWIQSYDPKKHDRFYSDPDKAFVGQAYDWSGVGYSSDGRWATMISPSYFLSAQHFHPTVGADPAKTITFYEGNSTSGTSHTYTVASSVAVNVNGDDLFLGKLTTAIQPADHIAQYPILQLGSDSAYIGREIYVYGNLNRLGRNIITSASGTTMEFKYDQTNSLGGDEAYLIEFDSGAPSFTVDGGSLALLGTHYYHDEVNGNTVPPADGSVSGDSFIPHAITQLQANMSGETLSIVPEPATVGLLLPLAALLLRRRRAA